MASGCTAPLSSRPDDYPDDAWRHASGPDFNNTRTTLCAADDWGVKPIVPRRRRPRRAVPSCAQAGVRGRAASALAGAEAAAPPRWAPVGIVVDVRFALLAALAEAVREPPPFKGAALRARP